MTQVLHPSHPETTTILAVDDDPIILTALRQLLTPWNMRVLTLDDPNRFWAVLNATAPDLVLLDIEMQNFSGIELCRAVRTDAQWGSQPIVFLTAHREADTVQQVFEVGADDYISKPIVGPEVLTLIMNRVERNRMLQRLAQKDALTGLPNHSQSYQALTTTLHQAHQHQSPLSRLTELRDLNITYGHSVGHRVLQRWGQILRAMLRRGEVVGYWEQGEFVIGIAHATKAEAQDILAEVLKTLRQQIFATDQGDRCVHLMGGEIEVKTQLGKGTTFLFTLPLQIAAPSDVEPRTPRQKVLRVAPGQPSY
jgi:diguanylate cyclase (GGDEF)-like protein